MTYAEILAPQLGRGFTIGEIVIPGSRTHREPPAYMRPRMLPVLACANDLRARMVAAGCRGLRVQAAYRPVGGARYSQHKTNRALDLDLLHDDDAQIMREAYYRTAVQAWVDWCASGLAVGLGFYCPQDFRAGRRVHIDVGYRTRTWQHGWAAGAPDAELICAELGLEVPRHRPR